MMMGVSKKQARAMVIFSGSIVLIFGGGQVVHHVFANNRQESGAGEAFVAPASSTPKPATLHAVRLRLPAGTPQVSTGRTDPSGQPVMVACSTCHTTTKPNFQTHSSAQLVQFHQGLNYVHGNLTCLSCHNDQDYNSLHLANRQRVEFADVMQLCAQCHGHQWESYQHGAHGGMNGHWDLTRGERTRNICTNCHDPHAPKFPLVQPIFPPRDRISVPLPGHRLQETNSPEPLSSSPNNGKP